MSQERGYLIFEHLLTF